tara:strand:- start:48 stop:833 length:786 start_codon:yes stop_codon:yes gene_type:complete
MIKKIKSLIIQISIFLKFDLRMIFLKKFSKKLYDDRREWLKQGGVIHYNYPIKRDFISEAGNAYGHYFHLDLITANHIFEASPLRHIDIGSRIDGFVAHIATFRKIEIMDIRDLKNANPHKNISFIKKDLMEDIMEDEKEITDSLSCTHALQHFGMGRYGDKIDTQGHIKGMCNMIKMLKLNGFFYLTLPIADNDYVHFNAHRVFKSDSVLNWEPVKSSLKLIRFDFIDDKFNVHLDKNILSTNGLVKNWSAGIYTFKKIR